MSGRVAVLGGSGFLGSHLCDQLLARGDEVVCVDDFSTGRRAKVAHLADHDRFTLVEADISTGIPVDLLATVVFNLASPASPPGYLALPLQTLAVESEGTGHGLELAARHGGRFLMASTSEVYSDPLTVYGNGSQTWSLCYVAHGVRGLLALFDSLLTGPVNIGNPDEYAIIQLARTIIELLDSASIIEHQPLPTDDPTRRRPDITVARAELGWEPTTSLEDGLSRTAHYLAKDAGITDPRSAI